MVLICQVTRQSRTRKWIRAAWGRVSADLYPRSGGEAAAAAAGQLPQLQTAAAVQLGPRLGTQLRYQQRVISRDTIHLQFIELETKVHTKVRYHGEGPC